MKVMMIKINKNILMNPHKNKMIQIYLMKVNLVGTVRMFKMNNNLQLYFS